MDPDEWHVLGRSGVVIQHLSLGLVPIGNLYRAISDEQANAVLQAWWDLGLRSFDVAPVYGYGLAELRLGQFLADKPRSAFYLSTKVGRLMVAGAPRDPKMYADGVPFFRDTPPGINPVYDYSASGVRRSLAESFTRIGVDYVDVAYIHDPDDHLDQAIEEAYPALDALRQEGLVRAIGVGVTTLTTPIRFARETALDIVMLASRFTILEQAATAELLPLLAERGIALVAGGVLNTGFLADPRLGAMYDYRPATDIGLVNRAQRIRDTCTRHGVPLIAVAIQFPALSPVVASIVVGAGTASHVRELAEMFRLPVPPALWRELASSGLVEGMTSETAREG